MKKLCIACATAALLLSAPASAAIAPGLACTPPSGGGGVITRSADNLSLGILECVPNATGNYFWQAAGAGVALYDNTDACATAGQMRWNGSKMQYCDGANWKAIGGLGAASLYACPMAWNLVSGGSWASFGCNGQISTVPFCQNAVWNGSLLIWTAVCPQIQ